MPEAHGAPWSARVVAIEEGGEERAFVALDDLERIATDTPSSLGTVLRQLRVVFESWDNRSGGIFIRKLET
jgi:hypothetical protein